MCLSANIDKPCNYCNGPRHGTAMFYNAVIDPKDANSMADSADSDQTPISEHADQDLQVPYLFGSETGFSLTNMTTNN